MQLVAHTVNITTCSYWLRLGGLTAMRVIAFILLAALAGAIAYKTQFAAEEPAAAPSDEAVAEEMAPEEAPAEEAMPEDTAEADMPEEDMPAEDMAEDAMPEETGAEDGAGDSEEE